MDKRHRKPLNLTLSPAAIAALEAIAKRSTVSKSEAVEFLALQAEAKKVRVPA